jgi:hypothetical protein
MKFSLTPGPRRPLDRQTAWGCLTANIFGLPGLGSLAAGRLTGYCQMALSLIGLALTTAFFVRFLVWYGSHSAELNQSDDDVLTPHFGILWSHLRWAFLGLGVFLIGWLWALMSGLAILAESKRSEPPKRIPPFLKP